MPVVIPAPSPTPANPIRDLILGRLALPTVFDPISEQLGSEVQASGDATAVGQRRVKGFTLNFPVHGDKYDANPYLSGMAMRRRLRSLIQNHNLRLSGVYIQFAFDPERNGWVVVGTGNLADNQGGATLAEFQLTLDQAFLVATRRTHREGFRCDVIDRRLSTSARDYEGAVTGLTDFASLPNLPLFFAPPGSTDLAVLGSAIPYASQVAGRDGACRVVPSRSNGDVVSWERSESNFNTGDVVAYDRRGQLTAPAAGPDTLWEEVYGPDYPWNWLTAGQPNDAPVLDNGLVRVRYDASVGSPGFRVDAWNGTAYVEQGKMIVQRIGDTTGLCDTFLEASLAEYSFDRAVLQVVLSRSADSASRERVYVAVNRGELGVTFEVYPSSRASGTLAGAGLFWEVPTGDANATALKSDTQTLPTPVGTAAVASTAGTGASSFGGAATLGATSFSASENLLALLRSVSAYNVPGPYQASLAVVQAALRAQTLGDSGAYGSAVSSLGTLDPNGNLGYAGAHLSFAPTVADQIAEAEAVRNSGSGTTSQVADATASGGQCVKDTQAAATNATLSQASTTLLQAKYRVLARVKVDSGATGSFRAAIGAATSGTITTTSTSWTWVDLGDLLPTAAAAAASLTAWRSAGTGSVYVDRVERLIVEDRTRSGPDYYGARDVAQAKLATCRPQPRRPARAPY